jgi:hypothetical protein
MKLPYGLKIALALLAGAASCRAADMDQSSDSSNLIAAVTRTSADSQSGHTPLEGEHIWLRREQTRQDLQGQADEVKSRALASEDNELEVLNQLPGPSSDDERTAECAWFHSEFERQQYLQQNLWKHAESQADADSWAVAITKVEWALLARIAKAGCV